MLIEIKDKIIKVLTPPPDVLDTPLAHYYGVCERKSLDLLAEPINLFTSFLFFLVAIVLYRYYSTHHEIKAEKIADVKILTIMIVLIGIGSSVFHASPSYYTELADITFIVLFIIIYFFSMLRRVIKANIFVSIICFLAFIGVTHIVTSMFPNALNDSIAYITTMGALAVFALYLNLLNRAAARGFLTAALVGCISLFFRVIDNEICEEIDYGSHFMWHSLNALLIYILMMQLVRNVNRRARMLRMAGEYGL